MFAMPLVPSLTKEGSKEFTSHFKRAVGDYGNKHPEIRSGE